MRCDQHGDQMEHVFIPNVASGSFPNQSAGPIWGYDLPGCFCLHFQALR